MDNMLHMTRNESTFLFSNIITYFLCGSSLLKMPGIVGIARAF